MFRQDSPLLTIIMPFYNNKEVVAEMLESIQVSTFTDWELLAIDDGSTKDTLAYLEEFFKDRRIRVIERGNMQPKGAQTCRNIGMREMRGRYVVFFDSDDYITPTCLETRIKEIEQRPELDFMVFPSGLYRDRNLFTDAPRHIYGYAVHNNDLASFARRELPFIVWTNIYRSQALRKHGLQWDTALLSLQDADFNMQALLAGLRYDYAKVRPDYGYRTGYNPESTANKIYSEEHLNSHLYATEKFFCSLQKQYGHRYDTDAFAGALYIYNKVFTDRVDKAAAYRMAKCVGRYNSLLGHLLKLQVSVTRLLELFLPSKIARQIPMALYLITRTKREKRMHHKIKPIE